MAQLEIHKWLDQSVMIFTQNWIYIVIACIPAIIIVSQKPLMDKILVSFGAQVMSALFIQIIFHLRGLGDTLITYDVNHLSEFWWVMLHLIQIPFVVFLLGEVLRDIRDGDILEKK